MSRSRVTFTENSRKKIKTFNYSAHLYVLPPLPHLRTPDRIHKARSSAVSISTRNTGTLQWITVLQTLYADKKWDFICQSGCLQIAPYQSRHVQGQGVEQYFIQSVCFDWRMRPRKTIARYYNNLRVFFLIRDSYYITFTSDSTELEIWTSQ